MKREQLEEWLSRDLDGELDAATRARLERALAEDPDLAARAESWRRIGRELRELPVPGRPTPEAMWQDVRRAIRVAESDERDQRSVFGWRMIWAAAAVVLLLGVPVGIRLAGRPGVRVAAASVPAVQVEYVETDLPGASTLVYQDEETGCALVWVSQDEPGETVRGT